MNEWYYGQLRKLMLGSGPTKHSTGLHHTTQDPKILGDGIDQTPQHTGDLDTLSQRGYGPTTLP